VARLLPTERGSIANEVSALESKLTPGFLSGELKNLVLIHEPVLEDAEVSLCCSTMREIRRYTNAFVGEPVGRSSAYWVTELER